MRITGYNLQLKDVQKDVHPILVKDWSVNYPSQSIGGPASGFT